MEGRELIPTGGPWKHPAERRCRVCSQALGPRECLDFQCTHSKQLEVPNALRKLLTSPLSPV